MPSARMGREGEIGLSYSRVPPYTIYNLRLQLTERLEVSGNYRIFQGVEDPILTPMGFGDFSDKGANFKLALWQPEDSDYHIPGVAIGCEDIMGTRAFKASYIVATQVFLEQNLEVSLGIGANRIRGIFGGASWMPFRKSDCWALKGLSLVAEYDAIPYKSERLEPHPDGRTKKIALNLGIKYRLEEVLDLSFSYIRGSAWAFSVSSYYNFGMSEGFLPKFDDKLPYKAPVDTEPLGWRRPEEVMAHELVYAMQEEGLFILEARIDWECGSRRLFLKVYNGKYRLEPEVRERLTHFMAYLIPSNIDQTVVVIESEGFSVQQYTFPMDFVRLYAAKELGEYELSVLCPLTDVRRQDHTGRLIFLQNRGRWEFHIEPKVHTLFGSSKGKFKYAAGIGVGLSGFLWKDLYYSICLGQIFWSDLGHLSGVDRLNPSQLPNVRTDLICYYGEKSLTVDEAFLQKTWNLGKGFYGRLAAGYFEQEYGGIATECLYYPLPTHWAIGLEAAYIRKRNLSGLGFTDCIRQLHGFIPTYHRWRGSQYFLDLYYEWPEARLDFKAMIGKFLANDRGVRFQVMRYFPSGLQLSLWYTLTNGHDKVNGQTYYDKGIAFSMPLDLFYTHSARTRWGYGMSAWLRDVGATASNGMALYSLIREQRNGL